MHLYPPLMTLCVCLYFQVLFALAALLRHFPFAQNHFLKLGGLHVLGELFRGTGGEVLRVRVVTMVYDMIMEKVSTGRKSRVIR